MTYVIFPLFQRHRSAHERFASFPCASSVIESSELPHGYYFQMTADRDGIVAHFPMKLIRSKFGLCVSAKVGNSCGTWGCFRSISKSRCTTDSIKISPSYRYYLRQRLTFVFELNQLIGSAVSQVFQ